MYQCSARSYNITEKSRLVAPFTCHADAYPPAQYYWIFANVGENITRTTGGMNPFISYHFSYSITYYIFGYKNYH